jgi:hypothetical protein
MRPGFRPRRARGHAQPASSASISASREASYVPRGELVPAFAALEPRRRSATVIVSGMP